MQFTSENKRWQTTQKYFILIFSSKANDRRCHWNCSSRDDAQVRQATVTYFNHRPGIKTTLAAEYYFKDAQAVPTQRQTINFNSNQNQFPFMNGEAGQTITNRAQSSCVSSINLFHCRLAAWSTRLNVNTIYRCPFFYGASISLTYLKCNAYVELRSKQCQRHHRTIPILVSPRDLFL